MNKREIFNKYYLSLLFLIAVAASVPLMTDYVLLGDSTAATFAHIENIFGSIGKVFPIRLGTLGMYPYGYSMAAFQADVFYLFPAVLRCFGVSLGNAFKITIFLFNMLTVLISFYCFCKIYKNKRAGIAAAMLFTWCPYRLGSAYTSGNFSELFAWTFAPIIIWGIYELFRDDSEEYTVSPWIILSVGFGLTALSSTVFLFVFAVMFLIICIFMCKKTFSKKTLSEIIKTILCVLCVDAWYIIPMLLRMRDASAVGSMITEHIRGMGMFITEYFTIFDFAGGNTDIWASGMGNMPPYEPGIATIILVLIYIWMIFTGTERSKNCFQKTFLGTGIIVVILSLNSFPWDIFQNKNMLFSIVLAFMENPARWGIAADVCLIVTAGYTLVVIGNLYGEKAQLWAIIAVTAVSYGTTQFLTGQILSTENFVKGDDITAFGNIEMPVIYGESIIWRLCEALSVISAAVLFAIWLVKRAKRKNKV